MEVTVIYAALLAFLYFALSVRTIRMRQKLRISVGDANNDDMTRAVRVHANFIEYVPLCLLLIFFVESLGAPSLVVHVFGAALFIGRMAHAYGLSQEQSNFKFRVGGMMLTFLVLLSTAACLLFLRFLG